MKNVVCDISVAWLTPNQDYHQWRLMEFVDSINGDYQENVIYKWSSNSFIDSRRRSPC